MKLKFALLAALISVSIPSLVAFVAAPAQAQATAQTTVFAVENMTCELCPITVRTAMERVPGVTFVTVDFEAKTATVTYDPTIVTIEAIAATSTNVGYPAHVLAPDLGAGNQR
jgi:periplasmic mercuric ion binding protein